MNFKVKKTKNQFKSQHETLICRRLSSISANYNYQQSKARQTKAELKSFLIKVTQNYNIFQSGIGIDDDGLILCLFYR
jgi:hypothetical protein